METPAKLKRAVERYGRARDARDKSIREAHANGMSYRAIAEVVGLSYQRVAQIVHGDS